jgi:hypothetical protein
MNRESLNVDKAESGALPPDLLELLRSLPVNVDRKTGADLITQLMFPISPRSLEAWPLPTRHVNGHAIVPTDTLFRMAYSKLSAAPMIMSGRRRSNILRAGPRRSLAAERACHDPNA